MIRIRLLWVGKAQERYVESGVEHFLRKLRPYARVECETVKPAKSGNPEQRRAQETALLRSRFDPSHRTVLLDEHGESRTSPSPRSLAGTGDDPRGVALDVRGRRRVWR